eukprot:gene3688-7340_t
MLGSSSLRRITNRGQKILLSRNMAGHGPAVPTEGIEGMVRKYLPGNHHVAMGILGFYFSLYMVSGLFSSKKKAPAVAAAPVASDSSLSSNAMPSFESPLFDKWISTPGNLEQYLSS